MENEKGVLPETQSASLESLQTAEKEEETFVLVANDETSLPEGEEGAPGVAELSESDTDAVASSSEAAQTLGINELLGQELADFGWLALPKPLFRNWRYLEGDLNISDVMLLILLMDYRSNNGSYMPVRVRALATQMGMGERALRKKIQKLKKLGLVIQSEEIGRKRSYDLSPLLEKLVSAQKSYRQASKSKGKEVEQ